MRRMSDYGTPELRIPFRRAYALVARCLRNAHPAVRYVWGARIVRSACLGDAIKYGVRFVCGTFSVECPTCGASCS